MEPHRRRTLARMLSQLDRLGPAESLPEIKDGRPIGTAFRIGITGPLGAGKSTLINQLITLFRQREYSIGIIAIDPTSPFTGGAVLGDRVRMTDKVMDDNVFIRSLATRGMTGGLTSGAVDAADLFDMFGFDIIIIETVGVGQTEVDIMEACDAVVVILEPSSGDGIQAIKAGLLEIADLFVVNKMDLKGADNFIHGLQTAIEIREVGRSPDIIGTLARDGKGVREVCDWLEKYKQSESDLSSRRANQRAERIRRITEEAVIKRIWDHITDAEVEQFVNEGGQVREAARQLTELFFKSLKI